MTWTNLSLGLFSSLCVKSLIQNTAARFLTKSEKTELKVCPLALLCYRIGFKYLSSLFWFTLSTSNGPYEQEQPGCQNKRLALYVSANHRYVESLHFNIFNM